ncbi:TonB-dependent receptor domain-containing protein [Prolixibacter sp. SD074]|uniref:TonB-dependent receptor n=1 Tax=Prolixibacter sp. SD074 TaxID=2652391 RepID=UPI00127D523D|nr:TonB-dependent receptor [Prolixibacter sp. SD074]GET30250.1 membrane protein [Prolixibacter sp. SD074]
MTVHFKKYFLLIYFWILSVPILFAQTNEGELYGEIIGPDGKGISDVSIISSETQNWSLTDSLGNYHLKVPTGKSEINIRHLGYHPESFAIDISPGQPIQRDINLHVQSLGLREIKVLASENEQSLTSATTIGQQAIELVQATNLGDIMQLLPGRPVQNPDLNSAGQAQLRGTGSSTDNKIDAFGTAIIVNGIPLSNDANMQVSNTSTIGANGLFSTVSGGGIDLRDIPADQISRIEVIRGIPSVRYGNLTSGVIRVETMQGKAPFRAKVRLDPTTQEASLGKGLALGKSNQTLNIGFDLTHSQQDLHIPVPAYNRATASANWNIHSNNHNWRNQVNLSLLYAKDRDKGDKDAALEENRYASDKGFRVSTKGEIKSGEKILKRLAYQVSLAMRNQDAYNKQLRSGEAQPLPTNLVGGTFEVPFAPAEYYTATRIEGKPVNFYASLIQRFAVSGEKVHDRFFVGTEWRTDVNHGNGKTFDAGYPPPSSYRPRAYNDVPALNQFSLFAENSFTFPLAGKTVQWQAGIRYDNVLPNGLFKSSFDTKWQPRTNLTYQLFPYLRLRGGYGITAKAPSLVYLYPEAAYFDAVSYMFYSATYPDERLALMTTHIFDATNNQLKFMTNRKAEIGVDLNAGKWSAHVTFYNEKTRNAYSFTDVPAAFPYPVYDTSFYLPGNGEKPQLDEVNVDTLTYRSAYLKPNNSLNIDRKGIEFAIQSPEITQTGTSFNLSGAWSANTSWSDAPDILEISRNFPNNPNGYMGMYESNKTNRELFLTTFRIVQHIPVLRFVATAALQNTWIDKYGSIFRGSVPVGYIDENGNTIPLTSARATTGFPFLIRSVDPVTNEKVSRPALWNLNLKLAKEIGKNYRFSFFANNMFMHNPAYANHRTGQIEKRNPALYFGGELAFHF